MSVVAMTNLLSFQQQESNLLAIDPSEVYEVCLPSDASKPVDVRPVFVFRHLTCREQIRFSALVDAACDAGTAEPPDPEKAVDLVTAAIACNLVSCRNVPGVAGPDDVSALPDLLTRDELWTLVRDSMRLASAREDDLKKSVSPSA